MEVQNAAAGDESPRFMAFATQVEGALTHALTGGAVVLLAENEAQRVALDLRYGLTSRALAIAALADSPLASAAMYDSLRTMCEAAARITWLADDPDIEARARCIRLGQAVANVENRRKLLDVHRGSGLEPARLPEVEQQLVDAERWRDALRAGHPQLCGHCNGNGFGFGVQRWLRARAQRTAAPVADINVYAMWVASSADAHQLAPNRHSTAEGNFLDLSVEERGRVVCWALDLLMSTSLPITTIVRPAATADVLRVVAWWEQTQRRLAA